jgi:osmotically-inducible protein OsmY
MTLIATLTTLALATPPLHVVPNTPADPMADGRIDSAEEQRIEVEMREWIGSTNTHPETEFVDVAIQHETIDGKRTPVMTLHGAVATAEREAALVAHAGTMPGIAVVEETLRVGEPIDAQKTVPIAPDVFGPDPDAEPHDAVVEALMNSPFVDSRAIVVKNTDGTIVLTGSVPRTTDISEAGSVARRTVDLPVDVQLTVRRDR